MSDITLTEGNLKKISEDMNEKVEMLTDKEVNALASKVNKAVNLPFINEEKEFLVFVKVVKLIDRKLYEVIPNEYYELVRDANNGINREEALVIEERVAPLINKTVNLPILTEKQEAKLISLVLGLIINSMVKGLKLEELDVK